jgi:asparagine synthase (glutamine-hydrolysing)
MCGIFGGYNINLNETEKGINLINRGNDGITISQLGDKTFFAARRHAIKFSGNEKNLFGNSDQPYYSDDKNVALIFNGEFYNFSEYKDNLIKDEINFKTEGDTEVLLKLYEKNGINFLRDKKIDALYSIAVHDKKLNKIFISRDWPGRIPLYYYHEKGRFIFSSELKAFRAISDLSLQDPIELEPGKIVEYDIEKDELIIVSSYDLQPFISKNTDDILKLGEEMHQVLNESAQNRTMGDVPICTMLSGGIDSVLTTYYVLKNIDFNQVKYQPTSYVFKVKGFDSIDVKTAEIATAGFQKIGLNLKIIEADESQIVKDMPKIVEAFEMRQLKALSFYPLPIYWYLAPEMHKDGFKVTIGGHGVDELLGAYTAWKELKTSHEAQIKLRSRKAFINNIYNNMLKRASIIFMNRGPIEARFPFLNHKVCEFMLGIDSKWLSLSKSNAEIMVGLIEESKIQNSIDKIYKNLNLYLNDEKSFFKDLSDEEIFDIEKIFWKFPLIASSYFASKESFLSFKDVFRPKIRGQHGAGITYVEPKIVNNYPNYGATDTDIFKNISQEIFR